MVSTTDQWRTIKLDTISMVECKPSVKMGTKGAARGKVT